MKLSINVVSLAGTILLSAFLASAQVPGAQKHRMIYDPATETNIKGSVEDVTQGTRGRMMGTHLTVKTGDATREVILGPSAFISRKGFSFAKGDSIEITGSKTTMGGRDYVIAREVVKDGKTLTLRDKNGRPQWAGKMMGPAAASRQ
jgi:DNA/RNA endonuclease YhcR with UshA esterase domain